MTDPTELNRLLALASSEGEALAALDGCVDRLDQVRAARAALARLDAASLRAGLEVRRTGLGQGDSLVTAPTSYSAPPLRVAVSVHELKRAWEAVQAGEFRPHPADTRRSAADPPPDAVEHVWEPEESVLPVVGCGGSVGATTLALALATAAAKRPARVVECCPMTASGLASASTAELGQHPSGWLQGTRDGVLLERGGDVFTSPHEVPQPAISSPPGALTVLDVGWELGQLLASPSWLSHRLLQANHIVAVTTATIPGLRRLESALALLEGVPVIAAVLGPRRRKWPRGLEQSLGALSRQLDQRGSMHPVPLDRGLAERGLDSEPLPAPLLTAAKNLLRASVAGATTKGNPT